MSRWINILFAIVGVAMLLAIAIPAINQAREAAHRTQCRNNLKQLAAALHNYHDVYSSFPPGTFGSKDRAPEHRWSFYPRLIPYLEQSAIPPLNVKLDSRDSTNWPLTFEAGKENAPFTVQLRAPMVITCPNGESDLGEHQQKLAGYVGVTGVGKESATVGHDHPQAGVWGYERSTSLSKITSKQDSTILLIETASDRDVWLFGGWPTVRWASRDEPQLGPGRTFGGFHSDLTMCVMVDGSVKSLSNGIDPEVFLQMARIHREARDEK